MHFSLVKINSDTFYPVRPKYPTMFKFRGLQHICCVMYCFCLSTATAKSGM